MANEKIICDRQDLVAIADAIREKTGSSDGMTLGQMDDAIAGIESGGSGGETMTICHHEDTTSDYITFIGGVILVGRDGSVSIPVPTILNGAIQVLDIITFAKPADKSGLEVFVNGNVVEPILNDELVYSSGTNSGWVKIFSAGTFNAGDTVTIRHHSL